MDVLDGVKLVLGETLELGDRVNGFDASTPLFESLAELDSMAVVNVVVALEHHFEITIVDDDVDAETFETVGALVQLVQSKRPG